MSLRPGKAPLPPGHGSQPAPNSGGYSYRSPPPRPPQRALSGESFSSASGGYNTNNGPTPPARTSSYGGPVRSSSPSGASPYYSNGYAQNNNGYPAVGYRTHGGNHHGYSSPVPATPMEQDNRNLPRRTNSKLHLAKKGGNSSPLLLISLAAAAILGCGFGFWQHLQIAGLLASMSVDSIQMLKFHVSDLVNKDKRSSGNLKEIQNSLRTANEHKVALERENRDLKKRLSNKETEARDAREQVDTMSTREKAWVDQVQVLRRKARLESEREVREKFGDGPHQVEFTVAMPTEDGGTKMRYFVVETAPLKEMPHSIHLFLEQVAHGLWESAWFYINGPHLMQVGPQTEEDSEEDENLARYNALIPFKEKNLESLAFPEYSETFPHAPWTIGFTGRPGGPDFYINKIDNSLSHGPGGQNQHDLNEFADPCFAKVIKGFELLEEVSVEETILEGPYAYFFEYPIHIVNATILANTIETDRTALSIREEGFADTNVIRDHYHKTNHASGDQHHFNKQHIDHQTEY